MFKSPSLCMVFCYGSSNGLRTDTICPLNPFTIIMATLNARISLIWRKWLYIPSLYNKNWGIQHRLSVQWTNAREWIKVPASPFCTNHRESVGESSIKNCGYTCHHVLRTSASGFSSLPWMSCRAHQWFSSTGMAGLSTQWGRNTFTLACFINEYVWTLNWEAPRLLMFCCLTKDFTTPLIYTSSQV